MAQQPTENPAPPRDFVEHVAYTGTITRDRLALLRTQATAFLSQPNVQLPNFLNFADQQRAFNNSASMIRELDTLGVTEGDNKQIREALEALRKRMQDTNETLRNVAAPITDFQAVTLHLRHNPWTSAAIIGATAIAGGLVWLATRSKKGGFWGSILKFTGIGLVAGAIGMYGLRLANGDPYRAEANTNLQNRLYQSINGDTAAFNALPPDLDLASPPSGRTPLTVTLPAIPGQQNNPSQFRIERAGSSINLMVGARRFKMLVPGQEQNAGVELSQRAVRGGTNTAGTLAFEATVPGINGPVAITVTETQLREGLASVARVPAGTTFTQANQNLIPRITGDYSVERTRITGNPAFLSAAGSSTTGPRTGRVNITLAEVTEQQQTRP